MREIRKEKRIGRRRRPDNVSLPDHHYLVCFNLRGHGPNLTPGRRKQTRRASFLCRLRTHLHWMRKAIATLGLPLLIATLSVVISWVSWCMFVPSLRLVLPFSPLSLCQKKVKQRSHRIAAQYRKFSPETSPVPPQTRPIFDGHTLSLSLSSLSVLARH